MCSLRKSSYTARVLRQTIRFWRTITLPGGVTVLDGTLCDSAAMIANFERLVTLGFGAFGVLERFITDWRTETTAPMRGPPCSIADVHNRCSRLSSRRTTRCPSSPGSHGRRCTESTHRESFSARSTKGLSYEPRDEPNERTRTTSIRTPCPGTRRGRVFRRRACWFSGSSSGSSARPAGQRSR